MWSIKTGAVDFTICFSMMEGLMKDQVSLLLSSHGWDLHLENTTTFCVRTNLIKICASKQHLISCAGASGGSGHLTGILSTSLSAFLFE